MAESYSMKAILSAQDKGFTSTLKNALGITESFASKIKSGFAFGVLTGIGQRAFSALSNSAGNLIGEIDSSNAAWKTFDGNMRIIGKDKKEVTKVKKELQKFAQDTIYSSSDMASTYAQLAAVGVDSADQLVKGFGGLAAAAENPQQAMKTLSQQATQMAGKPKVAWQDFKLMMEQTPAGIAAVAKEMGMTTSELVSNVQDGKVKTEDFFKAVEKVGTSEGFSKLATEYKTVGQAMDGLQETMGNKLTPAFDILSQRGISAVSALADKIGELDGEKIAKKVTAGLDKIDRYWGALRTAFSGVGTECKEAFDAVRKSCSGLTDTFKDVASVESFSNAMSKLAGWIKLAANFIEDHADTIAKVLPWVIKLGVAWKAFGIVKKYVPEVGLLTGTLKSLAGNAVSGLAGKLSKTSEGIEEAGKSSGNSSKKLLASAKAFMMVGAGVLMVCGGFALLAYSAIQLSNAGGTAIAVMFGMVAAVAALGIGMTVMLNSIKPGAAKLKSIALAFLAVGAAVLMVSAGFALMAYSAMQLSYAGAPAVAVMVGMVATMALLAVGAAVLGKALTAGAIGFIAFGGAIALVGVGTLLAAAGVSLLSNSLPIIIAYGAQGAAALVTLSGGMVVFAGGALAAGAACLVLGAGLAVAAVGVAALGVAVLVMAAGMAVAAGSMALLSLVLPKIIEYGQAGAEAITELGASLALFAVGAASAGAAALLLGAGILVCGAGLAVCAVAITVVAAGMFLIAAGAMLAAAGLSLMATTIPVITENGTSAAVSLLALGGALTVFSAGAALAGAAAIILGAGVAVISVAVVALSAGLLVLSAGIILASAGINLLSLALPALAAYGTQGASALLALGASMIVCGAGALVSGAGCLVLGAGLLVVAAAVAATAAGLAVVAVSLSVIGTAFLMVASGASLTSISFIAFMGASTALSGILVVLAASMLMLSAGSAAACVGVLAFGAAMLVTAAGTVIMAAAIKSVNSSMQSIASNADRAEKSLRSMQKSVNFVQNGLDSLEDKAKSAMNKLTSVFDNTVSKATSAGQNTGNGFNTGMQDGLRTAQSNARAAGTQITTALSKASASAKEAGQNLGKGFATGEEAGLRSAVTAASTAVARVNIKLRSGYSGAYSSGAYISKGFAAGMRSQLGSIKSAAAQMASAADKAIKAKAKIHSPSKVAMENGEYYGQGWINGILSRVRASMAAAEKLVSFPQVSAPVLSGAFGGELSADYDYYHNSDYTITVPLYMDGKEVAKATAVYTETELNKRQNRSRRKRGFA